MSAKEIDVHCPCCASRLTIDVRTETVLRWRSAAELEAGKEKPGTGEARWSSALGRVEERSGRGHDAFDAALEKEKGRGKDLDQRFREAREKARGSGEDLGGSE